MSSRIRQLEELISQVQKALLLNPSDEYFQRKLNDLKKEKEDLSSLDAGKISNIPLKKIVSHGLPIAILSLLLITIFIGAPKFIGFVVIQDVVHSAPPVLNSTRGNNFTNENITSYPQLGTSNISVNNATDWILNSNSIAAVNLPFEAQHVPANNTFTKLALFFENQPNQISNSSHSDDATQFGNNASFFSGSPTYNATGGRIGGAYQFDGVDDYLRVSDSDEFNLQSYTLEAWIKTASNAAQQRIVSQQAGGFWVMSIESGTLRFCDNFELGCATSTETVNDGLWHHVAVMRNVTAGSTTYHWFINGTRVKTVGGSSTATHTEADHVYIGSFSTNPGEFFNGTIDEVRVYNRSISEEEMSEHYNLGARVRDLSIYGNNATLNISGNTDPYFNATAGKIGGAYRFDGVNDFLRIRDQASLNLSTMTVEVWASTTASAAQTIIAKSNDSDYWQLHFTAGGSIEFCDSDANGFNSACLSHGSFNDGLLRHFVVVKNTTGTAADYKLYIDGDLNATAGHEALAVNNIAAPVIVGSFGGGSEFFNGVIDEVKVYNISLTGGQVNQSRDEGRNRINRAIHNSMLSNGQNWTSCVTPNNGFWFGQTVCSNSVLINNPGCGDINSSITILNNIERNGSNCFNANTNNILIDCSGFTISSNASNLNIGANITGFNNVTVKNCVFRNFFRGAQITDARNATLLNNSFIQTDTGINSQHIDVAGTGGDHLIDLNLITMAQGGNGITITGPNTNVSRNHINNTPGFAANGVQIVNSVNDNIVNNTLENFFAGGVALTSTSATVIRDNLIRTMGVGPGISLDNSNHNRIINNTFLASANALQVAGGSGTNNSFIGNIVANSSAPMVTLASTADSNFFINNSFSNPSGTAAIFNINGHRHNFTTNTITNHTAGAQFTGSENNTFRSNVFTNGTNSVLFNFNLTSNSRNNFLLNESGMLNRSLLRVLDTSFANIQWFVDVNVTDTSFNPISGATVNVTDRFLSQIFYGITDTAGFVRNITINQSFVSATTEFNFTPHNFTANKSGQSGSALDVPVNESKQVNITITNLAAGCTTITASTTLVSNVQSSGTCFSVTGSNLFIDCAGFNITYATSTSGSGITMTSVSNVTIRNCFITATGTSNSNIAVRLSATTSSAVINNTIQTNGGDSNYGVFLESTSNNNIVANNTIRTNGTGEFNVGVRVSGSSSNNISGNYISTNGTNSNDGVYLLSSSSNNFVMNNTISARGSGSFNTGIHMFSSSNGNKVANNFINTFGTASSNNGFFLDTISHGVMANNTINTSGNREFNYGLFLTAATNINITNNTIRTNGTLYSIGVGIESGSNNNNVTNNTIDTDGGDLNFGIEFYLSDGNTALENNISTNGNHSNYGIDIYGSLRSVASKNTIATNGRGNLQHGIVVEQVSHSARLLANNITTAKNNSYAIYIMLSNDTLSNNTLFNSPSHWIYTDANTFSNFSNTTFSTPNGSINFIRNIQINGSQDINRSRLNITFNNAFLNSTNLTFLNTSAQIALRGLIFTNPTATVDFEDDGTFADCPTNICTRDRFSGGVLVINVTRFTAYSSTETSVDSCPRTLTNPGEYSLSNSMTSNGSCITIQASNVTLNCSSFAIIGNGTGTGIGSVGNSNVTIKNCIISYFTLNLLAQGAASGARASGIMILNNTLANSTAGNYLISSIFISNSSIMNNTAVNGTGTGCINVVTSNNVTITNNTVSKCGLGINIGGVTDFGISYNYVFNTSEAITSRSSPTQRINVTNNLLVNNTLRGIRWNLAGSSFNVIANNTIKMAQFGIAIDAGADNFTITNNTIDLMSNRCIELANPAGGDNNKDGFRFSTITNNILSSCVTGIYIDGNSSTNYFASNTINASTNGIQLALGAKNNTFVDNKINSSSAAIVFQTSAQNNTFLNNSIFLTDVAANRWIATTENDIGNNFTNTTFLTGNGSINFVNNFTVPVGMTVRYSAMNVTFNNAFLNSTNLTFLNTSAEITLLGISFNNPQVRVDYEDDGTSDPCLLSKCVELSYSGTTFTFNVSSFTTYLANETGICGNILENTSLSGNVNANGTCYTLKSSNIFLNCSGFIIAGNTSDIGINVTSQRNIVIRNCIVENFSINLLFEDTNDSLAVNNTLGNHSSAFGSLRTLSSSNNNIENNTVSSLPTAILIGTGSNNTLRNNNGTSIANRGISLNGVNNSLFISNTALTRTGVSAWEVTSTVLNNLFVNITGEALGLGQGINFGGVNNTLINSTGITNRTFGIGISSGAENNTFEGSLFISRTNLGVSLRVLGELNTFLRNNLTNNTQILTAHSNTFRYNEFHGFINFSGSENNTLTSDNLFDNNLYVIENSRNLTVLNASRLARSNITVLDNSYLYLQWYVDVEALNFSSQIEGGITVNVSNRTGQHLLSIVTGSNGRTGVFVVTEMLWSATTQLNYTPHTISGNRTPFRTQRSTAINNTREDTRAVLLFLGNQITKSLANNITNPISVPINLSNFTLGNEAQTGVVVNMSPANCVGDIHEWNTSTQFWHVLSSRFPTIWHSTTFSQRNVSVVPWRGYYFRTNGAGCSISLLGNASYDNISISLTNGWNLVGWFTPWRAVIGNDSAVPNPFRLNESDYIEVWKRTSASTWVFINRSASAKGWTIGNTDGSGNTFNETAPFDAYWIYLNGSARTLLAEVR